MPTLVIHGDDDQVVPFEVGGKASAALVDGAELKVYPGAPHGITDTHKDAAERGPAGVRAERELMAARAHRVVVVGGGFGACSRRGSCARATSRSRSSTARTTTSSSRCSTRSRPGSSPSATDRAAAPRDPAQAQERPRRAGRGHWLRSRESQGRSPPGPAASEIAFPIRQPDRRGRLDHLVLRARRARRALAADEDDRRRAQPAAADPRGVRAGRDRRLRGRARAVAHLRRRRWRADRLRGRGTDRRARPPDAPRGLPLDRRRRAPPCSSSTLARRSSRPSATGCPARPRPGSSTSASRSARERS